MAELVSIADDREKALTSAVRVLDAGGLVALPTETVYGLSADATNGEAVARIYEAKGRPAFNPLIAHMSGLAMARRYVTFDPVSERLAELFWPGPLTLVLPLRPDSGIAGLTVAGLDTLAVRAPKGFASELIARLDRPLAAPSANISGRLSPTSAAHVMADIAPRIDLVLDGGPCPVGVESTIVKAGPDGLTLLRPGGLSAEEIEEATGLPVQRREGAGAIEAPGMMASHYAPDAPVRLDVTSVEPGEALVNFAGGTVAGSEQAAASFDLSPSGDLVEAAARLFDTLSRADKVGAARIAVVPIPGHGLGEAINDRLKRAAAPRE